MGHATHQPHQQPTPSADALAEADQLTRLAGLLYANAAADAEAAGNETRARELWQLADQNLAAAAA
jgi:hypothetical protein